MSTEQQDLEASENAPSLVDIYKSQQRVSPNQVVCNNALGERVCSGVDLLLCCELMDQYLRAIVDGGEEDYAKVTESISESGLVSVDAFVSAANELQSFLPIFQSMTGGEPDFDDEMVRGLVVGMMRQRMGIYSLSPGEEISDAELIASFEDQLDTSEAHCRDIRDVLDRPIHDSVKLEAILNMS